MTSILKENERRLFLKKLLTWYKKNGRHGMPWRNTPDPYAILISEFMLQQTTVAAVGPYYERFLKKFPSPRDLARADLNDVLALWSGLGYYARARHLWGAMKMIEEKFNGRIPKEVDQLMKLPGIGPYTAGAISSLAFNRPAVVLDGNIIRVLMRVLALEETPQLKAVQAVLRRLIYDLTQTAQGTIKTGPHKKKGARHTVLALMDVGATLCQPKDPRCGECPLSELCLARQFGKQNDIPPREEPLERPLIRRLYAVIETKGKWLMGQRPKEGLFGGLWEFIGSDVAPGVEPVLFLEKAVQREVQFAVRVKMALKTFDHQLTHRVIVSRSFLCAPLVEQGIKKLPKQGVNYVSFRWVDKKKIGRIGISSITKRIIEGVEWGPRNEAPSP